MNNKIERKFSPFTLTLQEYYKSPFSIHADPENPVEVKNLKRIVEGGGYIRRRGVRIATQEIPQESLYTVFFEHPNTDSQWRIEKHLEAKGHKLQTLAINS